MLRQFSQRISKRQLLGLMPSRSFITVIDQATVAYRQFLGSNRTRLEPGLRLNLPILHDTRRVDMREDFIKVENVLAYTKDNVPIIFGGSLFYQVRDAEKACFSVFDYIASITKVGTSTCRSIIGTFDYDKLISDQNAVNAKLKETIGTSIQNWGTDCTRFEIQSFQPQNAAVARQLELQMEAERSKRKNQLDTDAHVTTADGQRKSDILISQGQLESRKNQAEGDYIIEQRKADALKYELDAVTKGLTNQIKAVTEAMNGNVTLASQFLVEQQKLKHLQLLGKVGTNNTYFFPDGHNLVPTMKMVGDLLSNKVTEKTQVVQKSQK